MARPVWSTFTSMMPIGSPATGAGLAWTSSGQRITTTASAKAHTPTPTGTGSASDPRCGDQLQTDPASYHCSVITWRVASWVGGVGNAQSKLAQSLFENLRRLVAGVALMQLLAGLVPGPVRAVPVLGGGRRGQIGRAHV